MFKVISAEIKKIVSKPSIYILAIILAAILILGVFVYNPTPHESTKITLEGSTFTAKYAEFYKADGYKDNVAGNINNTISSINLYNVNYHGKNYTREEYITSLYEEILTEFYEYRNYASYSGDLTEQVGTQKAKLTAAIDALDLAINSSLQLSLSDSYSMLTTNANYSTYTAVIKEVKTWVLMSPEKASLAVHCKEFEQNLKPKLQSCLDSFIYPTLSSNFITSYTSTQDGSNLATIYTRLNAIEQEINLVFNEVNAAGDEGNNKQAQKMDELANLYVNTANTYINLVKYELIANAFESTTTQQQLDLLHLKNHSNYNNKSLLIKYN